MANDQEKEKGNATQTAGPKDFPVQKDADTQPHTSKTKGEGQLKAQTKAEEELVDRAKESKQEDKGVKKDREVYEQVNKGVTLTTIADLMGMDPREVREAFERELKRRSE